MAFDIVGEMTEVETIAVSESSHILPVLRRRFAPGRWRKRQGVAMKRLLDGALRQAAIHWFEAHGIGRPLMRIKRLLDEEHMHEQQHAPLQFASVIQLFNAPLLIRL